MELHYIILSLIQSPPWRDPTDFTAEPNSKHSPLPVICSIAHLHIFTQVHWSFQSDDFWQVLALLIQ